MDIWITFKRRKRSKRPDVFVGRVKRFRFYKKALAEDIMPSKFIFNMNWLIVLFTRSNVHVGSKNIFILYIIFRFLPQLCKLFLFNWLTVIIPIYRIVSDSIINYEFIGRTSSCSFSGSYNQRAVTCDSALIVLDGNFKKLVNW